MKYNEMATIDPVLKMAIAAEPEIFPGVEQAYEFGKKRERERCTRLIRIRSQFPSSPGVDRLIDAAILDTDMTPQEVEHLLVASGLRRKQNGRVLA